MELVYLWVDKYKNIENQGFNFSPRFTCSYENDELKIIDKEETKEPYLKNFFGKNINVTAIVGENGSGKSNILEMLFGNNIVSNCEFFYIVNCSKTTDIDLILYKFDDKLEIYSAKIEINKPFDLKQIKTISQPIDKFSTLFYSTSPYIDNMSNQDINIKDPKNLAISEKKTTLSYRLKSIENTISMIKNNLNFEKLFNLPEEVTIGIKEDYKNSEFYKNNSHLKDSIKTFLDKVKIAILCRIYKQRKKEVDNIIKTDSTLNNLFEAIIDMPVIGPSKVYINNFIKICNQDNSYIQINIKDVKTDFINSYSAMASNWSNLDIDLNILDFKWSPNLSTGQETYLFQFANLYNAMKDDMNEHNNYLILIDEGENTLHPNWQKSYVKYYVEFLEKNFKEKNIQLVFSTHSPFILSDLPKENVIFLKKDENENCKNVTKEINIDTFGANIHTLLSHGFFMKDGLMGEFAKGKIEDAINYLNDKESTIKTNDEAQKLLNIIGEPVIKSQLQRMLDSKRLSKIDKIDKLEEELELIKHRIEMIRKNQ